MLALNHESTYKSCEIGTVRGAHPSVKLGRLDINYSFQNGYFDVPKN